MKFGSLFSGVGGFDLGFEQAGHESAWQVEVDKDCKRVLKRHWPNVELFDDVRTVGKLSDVDVLCGGFPCQDLSVAGKRKGLAGERSGLWFEFLRIAELNKPRWLVIENVPGLLSSESGADFRIIIDGLVNVGYRIAWRVLDAQYFGVAQRRRRVFIVGSLGDGSCAEILFESEGMSGDSPPLRGERPGVTEVSVRRAQTSSNGWGVRTDGSTGTLDGTGGDAVIARSLAFSRTMNHYDESQQTYVTCLTPWDAQTKRIHSENGAAPSLASSNSQGGQRVPYVAFTASDYESGAFSEVDLARPLTGSTDRSRGAPIAFHENKSGQLSEADVLGLRSCASHSYQGVAGNFGVRRLTPRECERLQGFPDDWTRYDSEAKEISDSARYRMLGNAVAVPNAKWIGTRLEQHSTRG